jgi:hypothetical protein
MATQTEAPKKKRGRPPKVATEVAAPAVAAKKRGRPKNGAAKTGSPADQFEAARDISKTLAAFDAASQDRILRWVKEKLEGATKA